jgi:hypothetical protein
LDLKTHEIDFYSQWLSSYLIEGGSCSYLYFGNVEKSIRICLTVICFCFVHEYVKASSTIFKANKNPVTAENILTNASANIVQDE